MTTLETMYSQVVGKPSTNLTAAYTAGTDSTISVANASALPAAPNLITVMSLEGTQLVTVKYESVSNNVLGTLTVIESYPTSGATATYPIGSAVSRPLTKADVDAIQANITAIDNALEPVHVDYFDAESPLNIGTPSNGETCLSVDSDYVWKVWVCSIGSALFWYPTDAVVGKVYAAAKTGVLAELRSATSCRVYAQYADIQKLAGIQAGAQVNAINGVQAEGTDLTIANKKVNITRAGLGLGNVNNTSDANKPVSTAQAAAIAVVQNDVNTHEAKTNNPHAVTKTQVGLSNVDNTSDANKPVSTAQAAAIAVVQNDVNAHEAKTNNPHGVTKAQVGLRNTTDGAQINVLEGVQIEGADQVITNKKINLTKASSTKYGLFKVGNTLEMGSNGVLNVKQGSFGWDCDMSLSNPAGIVYTGDLFGLTQAERTTYIDTGYLSIAVCKNGTEQYLLNKTNWGLKTTGEASNLTGTDGDVMLRIAKLYTKHYLLPSLTGGGRILCFRAAKSPFAGAQARAHTWLDADERDFLYIGTFEGTTQNNALMSVYSTTEKPKVSITLDAFRAQTTEAVKGGAYYGVMNPLTKTLWNDLFICVYGTRNGQAACGNGLVGLSAASPVGKAELLTAGMTYGTTANSTDYVKALYLVNPWGNVWEFLDGFIMFDYRAYVNPHAGGMINLYPNNVAVTEAAVQAAGYEVAESNVCRTNGYQVEQSGNDIMPFLPTSITGGSSTTFWTDYYWQNPGARIARAGGRWDHGAYCGAFCLALDYAPSGASANIGARLQMLSAT